MRWTTRLTREAKKERKENWHVWFAWFPVVVDVTNDHHKIRVWWENVERRGTQFMGIDGYDWSYEYREVKQ